MDTEQLDILCWGSHTISEALDSDQAEIHRLYTDPQGGSGLRPLLERARAKKVSVRSLSRSALSQKTGTTKHQNVAADISLTVFRGLESLPLCDLVLATDEIQDPQNLGSLFRSAHFLGAGTVVMTRDRSSPLTGAVAKASAGALFSLPVVRVPNLARTLERAEKAGYFRIGLEAEAPNLLSELDIRNRSVLLVVGSEGKGLRRLTKERCDALAQLTRGGERDSLNASVAGGIALYEVARTRRAKNAKS